MEFVLVEVAEAVRSPVAKLEAEAAPVVNADLLSNGDDDELADPDIEFDACAEPEPVPDAERAADCDLLTAVVKDAEALKLVAADFDGSPVSVRVGDDELDDDASPEDDPDCR